MEENKNIKPSPKKKKKPKYKSLNPKNWGIDYNKNEYQEIILSNSNHPEIMK
ncbi:MAG: hypothetical protein IJ003_05735 [Candidatus Gastranaerophilales bacterium]|mgnify:CR=1 FL=1|nr:hypothetical protein [Candidatus Gastranaerophilales bacterium]